MKNRYSFESLFESNKMVLLCVLFTINIIIETVSSAIWDRTTYLSIEFLIWNVVSLGAPILPLVVFQYLWKSNYINDKDYLLWAGIPTHYLISCGLILFSTFIRSLFEPLIQRAYIVSFINYTLVYAIVLIGAIVIDLMQTATANGNLRKIQTRLNDTIKN